MGDNKDINTGSEFLNVVGSLMLRLLAIEEKLNKFETSLSPMEITQLKNEIHDIKKILLNGGSDKGLVRVVENLKKASEENTAWRKMIEKRVKQIFWGVIALLGGSGIEKVPEWIGAIISLVKGAP